MKTIKEIEDEILELSGANKALGDAMAAIFDQQKDVMKKLFALNNMRHEMKNDEGSDA
jgi:hypothetical protein